MTYLCSSDLGLTANMAQLNNLQLNHDITHFIEHCTAATLDRLQDCLHYDGRKVRRSKIINDVRSHIMNRRTDLIMELIKSIKANT